MPDEGKELEKKADELEKRTTGDNALTAAKAIVAAIPFVGGALSTIMSDVFQHSREKRIVEFARKLASDMTAVQGKLDEEYIKTEDFAHLFTSAYRKAVEERGELKLDAYKNLLVNVACKPPGAMHEERMLRAISQLTDVHFRVLSCFISDDKNETRLKHLYDGIGGSLTETIRTLCPELNSEDIKQAVFDLDREDITNRVTGSLNSGMTAYGATRLENRVTPFGRMLIDYVLTS